MIKRVGVLLAGCGVYDGAEIQEAVLTLLALDRAGVQVQCMAPAIQQMHVINHLMGEPTQEQRDVLLESARIARGNIREIAQVSVDDLDALILPGGFGAAKNLCDFAVRGASCDIHPEVTRLILGMHAAGKPIGAMCIAPAVVARAFKDTPVQPILTIGDDGATAAALEKLGAHHRNTPEGEIIVDETNKIVSTPAYMYDSRISAVARGIERLVARVLELA